MQHNISRRYHQGGLQRKEHKSLRSVEDSYSHTSKTPIIWYIEEKRQRPTNRNSQGLLKLLDLQVYRGIRKEIREMVYCNRKFENFYGLFMGQSPYKPSWISGPKSTRWNSPPWSNYWPSFKDWVSPTKEPSMRMECRPIMHSGSIVQDLKRLYAPIVTHLSIEVSAGRPSLWKCGYIVSDK